MYNKFVHIIGNGLIKVYSIGGVYPRPTIGAALDPLDKFALLLFPMTFCRFEGDSLFVGIGKFPLFSLSLALAFSF